MMAVSFYQLSSARKEFQLLIQGYGTSGVEVGVRMRHCDMELSKVVWLRMIRDDGADVAVRWVSAS